MKRIFVPVHDRILSALRCAGREGMTMAQICERVGQRPSDIVSTLSRMCDKCEIDAGPVDTTYRSGRKTKRRVYWFRGSRPYGD